MSRLTMATRSTASAQQVRWDETTVGRPVRWWQRLVRHRPAMVALLIIVGWTAAALAAPVLAPTEVNRINLREKLVGPSPAHLLGTDQLGRDVLSRLLFGARITLSVGFLAMGCIMTIGVAIGLIAGYYGGWIDDVLSALMNVLLALPRLSLMLAIAGVMGPGLQSMFLALIAVSWVEYARVFRGATLAARSSGYVEAVRALGATHRRILVRYILPNIIGPVVVLATLDLGSTILAVASLSFLGLGVQPPTPDWGMMLSDARPFFGLAPHLMLIPGACIMSVVLAANILGDALRDALDPTAQIARRNDGV